MICRPRSQAQAAASSGEPAPVASATAWPASAVSHTGDRQGWHQARSGSATSSLRTAAQAVAAGGASGGNPSVSNIITLLAIAG